MKWKKLILSLFSIILSLGFNFYLLALTEEEKELIEAMENRTLFPVTELLKQKLIEAVENGDLFAVTQLLKITQM
jgi:hypothetical protein